MDDSKVKQLRDVMIEPEATILYALNRLNETALQILLVVDSAGYLLGSITDGDIRRAILCGVDLDGTVPTVMRSDPATVAVGTSRAAVLALMRSKEIHCIPVVDCDGRVVALETETHLLWHGVEDSWVVLMAGGLGTRLRPLTNDTPKPLLEVNGKAILETILARFVEQGFRRFFITVNYKADLIKRYFGSGARWGCEISYIHEPKRMGTAGSLSMLPTDGAPPQVVVMNGDLLTSVDFRQLLDYHQRMGVSATMCVRDYSIRVPYGVVEVDGCHFQSIQEKPAHQYYVNAGIYALDSTVIHRVPKDRYYEITDFFLDLKSAALPLGVFPLREEWIDIGDIDEYRRANAMSVRGSG
ncbi:MAG: nucleotidyltransferase family protein [Mariprofundales bacterium]|nr:nucleotidyltransferase family protein [Mariprofundales bacterium]